MTQRDRDRLVVLRKAAEKKITQKQAAAELRLSERQVGRLLREWRRRGDQAVIHGLRGQSSNRKRKEELRQQIVSILLLPQWRDFGPTLASFHLATEHDIHIGREALRQLMIAAGLWRAKPKQVKTVHIWRQRRSCRGELVQWDTSDHDWLEGRGPRLYLIAMIDDATGELTARFARHDSTEENMTLLWTYLERNGRPVAFYTDKNSMFHSTPKNAGAESAVPRDERDPPAPTQIGRALQELQIALIPAHSPQAKGRIERVFATAQDRLVKGLRLAGVSTLQDAQEYLQSKFLPWWNEVLTVVPASRADAHRPLGPSHDLASALSQVKMCQVTADYTVRHRGKMYQIAKTCVRPGMRGGKVRMEARLDGTLIAFFQGIRVELTECNAPPKAAAVKHALKTRSSAAPPKSVAERTAAWRASSKALFGQPGPTAYAAGSFDRTRTRDTFD